MDPMSSLNSLSLPCTDTSVSVQFDNTDDLSKAVPVSTIIDRAKQLKEEGPPRAVRLECFWPENQDTARLEKDKEKGAAEEDLVSAGKDWLADPLHLWMEDTIVELLENHSKMVRSVCVCVCVLGVKGGGGTSYDTFFRQSTCECDQWWFDCVSVCVVRECRRERERVCVCVCVYVCVCVCVCVCVYLCSCSYMCRNL